MIFSVKQVNITLQIQSRRYRQGLTALLASIPGARVSSANTLALAMDSSATMTDILLCDGDLSDAEQIAAMRRARIAKPELKTILLVDSNQPYLPSQYEDVDIVMPVSATAGELFALIESLVRR